MENWIDRQLPANDEVFLDHVGYFVADLEKAGAQLERLGFQVSRTNVQTNVDGGGQLIPSGTSNRLVRLRRGYLEVLAATHPTPLAAQLERALARYAGIHLVALSHDDIPAQRGRLTAQGFAMQEVVHLRRRDVTLPDAPEVAWSVLRPQPGVMPEGRIQFTKSHNPEHVWKPELTRHRNQADALTDLLLCVSDGQEAATRFSRYVGREAMNARDGVTILPLERGRLIIVQPEKAAAMLPGFVCPDPPYFAGQALRSSDIGQTRAVIEAGGISPVFADQEMVCVAALEALGAAMLFHRADLQDPWHSLAERVR